MKKFILFVFVLTAVTAFFIACGDKSPAAPKADPCGIVFGDILDDDISYWNSDNLLALAYTPDSGKEINRLGVKLNADTNYILAIYDDNSGEPGDVLAQTSEQSGITGWNEAALASPVLLSAGVKYWVVSIAESAPIKANGSLGTSYYSYSYSDAASLGMPGGLTGWVGNGGRIKVYATTCQ